MRFMVTITTAVGTLNAWTETENGALMLVGFLVKHPAATRVQIHEMSRAGLIVREALDAPLVALRGE